MLSATSSESDGSELARTLSAGERDRRLRAEATYSAEMQRAAELDTAIEATLSSIAAQSAVSSSRGGGGGGGGMGSSLPRPGSAPPGGRRAWEPEPEGETPPPPPRPQTATGVRGDSGGGGLGAPGVFGAEVTGGENVAVVRLPARAHAVP